MVLVPVNRTDTRRRGDRAKAAAGERQGQTRNRGESRLAHGRGKTEPVPQPGRKAAWPAAGKEQSESLRQPIGALLVYEAEDDELGVKV